MIDVKFEVRVEFSLYRVGLGQS